MSSYTLLDQPAEGTPSNPPSLTHNESPTNDPPDSLHKSRLLNVEEKPFKRITKRLLTPTASLGTYAIQSPTPPPDSTDQESASTEPTLQELEDKRRQFREDVILDFSAFDTSIARIQFLLTSNLLERQRYAEEKVKIQKLSQDVRDNTAELRQQLLVAQETLKRKKKWDVLAEKITSNRQLRPRDEQEENLRKLQEEIEGLEAEKAKYKQTWAERREQFERIVQEGLQLRKLIRDEKEEVERREGIEGEGDREPGDHDDGDGEERESGSVVGTPRPELGGATPMHPWIEGSSTPGAGNLMVERQRVRGLSPLRQSKLAVEAKMNDVKKEDEGEGQDSVMGDADDGEDDEGEISESVPTRAHSIAGDRDRDADEDEREKRGEEEDGEAEDGETKEAGDQMDTT
jgi:hypothetical protein